MDADKFTDILEKYSILGDTEIDSCSVFECRVCEGELQDTMPEGATN